MANEMNLESHMELNSHANMPMVGKYAYIIAETGKKVDVSPFTPNYQPLTVPLVDAPVRYNNPYNGKPDHTYWCYEKHFMSHQWRTTSYHHSC